MLALLVRQDRWLVLRVAGKVIRIGIATGEPVERVRICVDAPRDEVNVGLEAKPEPSGKGSS